jgi:diaminohydroxyphosphoribosylaminopyrimidine deaminase/5-amino-6-(5-phosphoribosylamino)uracil reductase
MVFTGIVQAVGRAVFDVQTNKLHVKAVSASFWSKCASGDSIAINGCCLTILHETDTDTATFFVMEESRAKTNLANLSLVSGSSSISSALSDSLQSTAVNMERALKVGDPLGGHTVTGHIDGVAPITALHRHEDGSLSVWIKLPANALVVHKGSIALDGVSLTVAELKDGQLRVSLIPHTLEHTTLHLATPGRLLNVEFDQNLKLLQQQATSHVTPAIEVASMEPYARLQVDEALMRRAIEIGENGKETASPNPWVGAVITDRFGKVLSEGFHSKAGTAHAEIRAIQNLQAKFPETFQDLLEGATCYTTLEPCSHFGRTGPCDQALIKHKFARVVVAVVDPDTNVAGQGVANLKAAGLVVETGVLEAEAAASLRSYLHHRRTGRPLVVLKIAASLDGKICARDGSSQWISSERSRNDVHTRLRATSQAVLVGANTAKVDDPTLTTRALPQHLDPSLHVQPLRVVIGKHVVLGKNLLNTALAPTIVYTSEDAKIPDEWEQNNVQYQKLPLDADQQIPFVCVIEDLAKRGVLQVLVEGGAHLSTSLLHKGLVDHLVIYQAPIILGKGALDWSVAPGPATLVDATPLHLLKVSTFGNDVCLEYKRQSV